MERYKFGLYVLLISALAFLAVACGDDEEDSNNTNPAGSIVNPENDLNYQPLVKWGSTRDQVKQYQGSKFHVVEEDAESIVFTNSEEGGNVVIAYQFDENDQLCAASLIIDRSTQTEKIVEKLLSTYIYKDKQNGRDVYLSNDLTTLVVYSSLFGSSSVAPRYTIGWASINQKD